MTNWKALADQFEREPQGLGVHAATIAAICRTLAELVPQELPIPGENANEKPTNNSID